MTDLVINFDDPTSKKILWDCLKNLKGEHVFKIKRRSKGRSIQENKFYWGVLLQYIEDETGVSKYLLHEIFKDMFIPLVKFEDDYRLTTSDLTHEQVWDYIDKIRLWAKEFLNLAIPDPDGVIL